MSAEAGWGSAGCDRIPGAHGDQSYLGITAKTSFLILTLVTKSETEGSGRVWEVLYSVGLLDDEWGDRAGEKEKLEATLNGTRNRYRQKHKERRKQQETQEKEAKHLHHDMFFCEGIVSCLVLFIFNLADFIQAGRECHKATVMWYFTLSCIYIYIYCNFHPRCNPSMAEIISPLWCKLSLTGSRLHHVRLLSWKTNQCERLKDKPSTHRQQTAGGGKIISMWLTTWKTMWGQNSTHRSQERSLI